MAPKRNNQAVRNRRLVARYQSGDPAALELLVQENLGLVHMVSKNYRLKPGDNLEAEDLIQVGAIGIVKAAKRWREEVGCEFSTLAVWWIRSELTNALRSAGMIKIPAALREESRRIQELELDHVRKTSTRPSQQELAELSGLQSGQVASLLRLTNRVRSLNESPLLANGLETKERLTLAETIQDHAAEAAFNKTELRLSLEPVLGCLDARSRSIVELRFGLTDHNPRSYAEIGALYGITAERARAIVKTSLSRIRRNRSCRGLVPSSGL